MSCEKKLFPLPDGRIVEARMPVIVSASRRTDIPAFYADWFFDRLEKGYSLWTNPFNKQDSYVSYRNTSFIVFWSKNPRPLAGKLPVLASKRIGCYIQYTLNDYEKEGLEPNVPPLAERIETFRLLSDRLGKEAVIWRFDPLLLTEDLSIDGLLQKVERIGDWLQGYTEKLVFSYADVEAYRKVRSNLQRGGVAYREWTELQMEEFASRLSALNRCKGWGFTLATCGEKISLERFGIVHNACIDGDLIRHLAGESPALMKAMGVQSENVVQQGDLFAAEDVLPPEATLPPRPCFKKVYRKDPGQRKACGCMESKDIGEYDTCPHLCLYCYANANPQKVLANWEKHKQRPFAETITGK